MKEAREISRVKKEQSQWQQKWTPAQRRVESNGGEKEKKKRRKSKEVEEK